MGVGRTLLGAMLTAWLVAVAMPSRAMDRAQSDEIINSLTTARSFLQVSMSPDGKRLAALGYNGFGSGLFIGDTDKLDFKMVLESRRETTLNYLYTRSPVSARWIDNDLIAVEYNDDEAESIDATGRKVAELGARYLGRIDAEADRAYAGESAEGRQSEQGTEGAEGRQDGQRAQGSEASQGTEGNQGQLDEGTEGRQGGQAGGEDRRLR